MHSALRELPSAIITLVLVINPVGGFQAAIDHAEKQLLQEALRNTNGNKTAAAALGMKPSTFRDKLAKHGLG